MMVWIPSVLCRVAGSAQKNEMLHFRSLFSLMFTVTLYQCVLRKKLRKEQPILFL